MRVLETVHDIVGYQVSDLISQKIMTVNKASDWLIHNLGTVKVHIAPSLQKEKKTECDFSDTLPIQGKV